MTLTFRAFFTYIAPILIALMILKMATQSKPVASQVASRASSTVSKAVAEPVVPNPNPFPAYFFSHGGPTFIYEEDDFGNKGAWKMVKKLGKTIKNDWKPDYIVVVSAHWQLDGSNLVEVAVPPKKSESDLQEYPLIYDFYGFPDHMYKEQFRTLNSRFLSEKVSEQLKQSGFNSRLTTRGVDHGVWVPFKVAFSDHNTLNPPPNNTTPGLDLPETSLIQVSLTGLDRDFDSHFKLGQALSYFRDNMIWDPVKEKYLKGMVVCSGMTVHNLRDLGVAMRAGKAMPYAKTFNQLLRETMVNSPDLAQKINKLKLEHSALLYRAHPTLEHFDPLVVAGGLIESHADQEITELYNDEFLSLGWGIYQFGPNFEGSKDKPVNRL